MILIADIVMFGISLGIIMRLAFVVSAALVHVKQNRKRAKAVPQEDALCVWPGVSIIMAAYNEEECLARTVRSVQKCNYPLWELIIINDGSRDRTAEIASTLQAQDPRIRVVSYEQNRGKVAALNMGWRAAQHEVVVVLDADTCPEPDALQELVRPMLKNLVAAVAGNIKVAQRKKLLTQFQSIEYIASLNLDRRAQAILNAITTVPGAMGAFRRSVLQEIGGFDGRTLAEDTDLSMTLLSRGYTAVYADRAIAYTQAPTTLTALYRQRLRWLSGNLSCAFLHAKDAICPHRGLRYFGIPNFWFTQLFAFLIPPLSLVYLPRLRELVPSSTLWTLSIAFYAVDIALVVLAFLLDREPLWPLLLAPLQRVFFPLFMWAVFAVIVVRRVVNLRPAWR